uniref:PX domain-containing protein n=1 Tax=Gadus morhua TaxID=8049 RepID=A0A8C5F810_GADMO
SLHSSVPQLYRVDVLFNGRKHCVLRRHSEFQVLHRKLRKIVQIPDFPSKRNPHLRTKPVEQRRQELEDYIQDILYQYEDVPQELLDFLLLRHFHTGNKDNIRTCMHIHLPLLGSSYQLPHQRVLGFSEDPYITSCLPDMVVDGVLEGFYPRDVRVSFTACTKDAAGAWEEEPPIILLNHLFTALVTFQLFND